MTARSDRHSAARHFFFVACVVVVLLHCRTFYQEHTEGDERVYLSLAREMNWDLTHYTTRDDPDVSGYPFLIYQQDLFFHPPLFPFVLKVGHALGRPVATGLVVQTAAMLLLLVFARRFARLCALSAESESLLYLLIAMCPILLYSTTKLHHDALMAVFLAGGLVLYVEALEARSIGRALGAGLLLVAALNTRYTAFAVLPLLPLGQALLLWRTDRRERWDPAHWRVLAVVALLVATLGLQHYYRVFSVYGTFLPSGPTQALDDSWSEFLSIVAARSRPQMLAYLLLIFPVWGIFVIPGVGRVAGSCIRERRWEIFFFVAWLYWLAVTVAFTYRQLRLYAGATLLSFFAIASVLQLAEGRYRILVRHAVGASLFLMLTTSILNSLATKKALLVPSIFSILPFLGPWFR